MFPYIIVGISSMQTMDCLNKPLFQSNVVTSARTDLSRDQRRVLYLFLRETFKSGFPPDGYFELNHKDYAAIFKIGEQEARDDLRKAIKGFKGKVIQFYEDWEGESADVEYDWTHVRRIALRRGKYSININPMLRQHLEPLAHNLNFTGLDLEDLSKLKSKWSQRLYEALCQFRTTGLWTITLKGLRERWDLPESYKNFYLLRTRVLEPAIRELKQISLFQSLTMSVKENEKKVNEALMFQFTPFKREF